MTRILLVEDNRGDARLFAEMLSEVPGRPFALTSVDTLAAALGSFAGHDVVFLDLSLPDAHGLDTLARMLAVAGKTPIIVLTGNDDDRVAMEAVKLGAQDYLRKSELSPSLVARTAWYAIERKKAEDSAHRMTQLAEAARHAKLMSSVSEAVTRSFDVDRMLHDVAPLLVPALADFCMIDVVREGGGIERVSLVAADPQLERDLASMRQVAPGTVSRRAIATKQTQWVEGEALLAAAPEPRIRAMCERFAVRAFLVTPLVARGRVTGAISYGIVGDTRALTDDQRLLAEMVAERIALGLDNAALYAAAQRAVRGRDELLAVVSHDLRNPLGVVALALEMMQAEPGNTSPLPRAQRAIDRMQRLIGDLLDVARIEAGTLRVELAPIELGSLLDETLEHHRTLARDRNVELLREPGHPGVALADRHRLGQTLANLIDNALKFTPAGGTIRFGATREGEHVVVTVADSGAGIAAAHLPHIFDRFWQPQDAPMHQPGRSLSPANGHRKRDGIGLGLAIVKGIVDAHGGKIDVDSRPGSGTTFRITLRAAATHAEGLVAAR